MTSAKVMNGEVEPGHRIAYAVGQGSTLSMNIGTVVDVFEGKAYGADYGVPKLRVNVTQSTGYRTCPRETVIDVLDRVVKL